MEQATYTFFKQSPRPSWLANHSGKSFKRIGAFKAACSFDAIDAVKAEGHDLKSGDYYVVNHLQVTL